MWNPYAITGVSQIDIIAPTVFYPLNWIFALVPFNQAFALLMIAQQLTLGIATFLLIAGFGWGPGAAIMGGSALALCGLTFSLQPTPTLQGTIAWFMCAYLGQRLIDTPYADRMIFRTACSAFLVYMMIVAGVAEAFAPGLLFLMLHAVYEQRTAPKHKRRRARWIMLLRFTALGVGVLMSAGAVLPAIEWSRLSPRALGLPFSEMFSWSCNWYDFLCVWCLQPLGDMYEPTNPFRPLVATSANQTPYLANAFLGPFIATAALWAAFDKTFKARWVAIAVLIGSLVLASGWHFLPTFAIVKALNLRMFRYPVKAMAFAAVSASLLAARGVHLLASAKRSPGNLAAWILWTAAAVAGLLLQVKAVDSGLTSSFHLSQLFSDALPRCGIMVAFSAALGLQLAIFYTLQLKSSSKSACLIAAIVIAETVMLFSVDAWRFNRHDGPADCYTRPCLVADMVSKFAAPEGKLRTCAILYANPYTPPAAMHPGPRVLSIYGYAIDLMVPHTNIAQHIRNITDAMVGETAEHSIIYKQACDHYNVHQDSTALGRFCQMSAARLLINQLGRNIYEDGLVFQPFAPLNPAYFRTVFTDTKYNLAIYQVLNPLSRAHFAATTRPYATAGQALSAVLNPDQSGFEPHKMTILEPNGQVNPPASAVDSKALQASRATFIADRPEYISLDVVTPVVNYLVLTDQFYPGWSASIDGKKAPIFRADAAYRAVLVPGGSHRVEFTYEPAVWRAGLILHAVAWALIACLLALSLTMRVRRLAAAASGLA